MLLLQLLGLEARPNIPPELEAATDEETTTVPPFMMNLYQDHLMDNEGEEFTQQTPSMEAFDSNTVRSFFHNGKEIEGSTEVYMPPKKEIKSK